MAIVQEPLINVTTYQVIYGDTDQMGVVYYANYLRLFEKGRSEFLRQIGSPYAEIALFLLLIFPKERHTKWQV